MGTQISDYVMFKEAAAAWFGSQTVTTSNLTVYTPPVINVSVTAIGENTAAINFSHSRGTAVL